MESNETHAWSIDEQPIGYQARYWKMRAEQAEAAVAREQRRKAPEHTVELEKEVHRLQETERILRADVDRWRKVGEAGFARVHELESEGPAQRLKRELEFWKERWRTQSKRIADLLEHQANVELLEDLLAAKDGMKIIRQRAYQPEQEV